MTRRGLKQRGATPAGQLVSELISKLGIGAKVREQRLVTEWERIVGPRVAARARPDGLERGVLYVRVTNSAWMHELGFLRQAMIDAARRVTGDPPIVKEVRFHLGTRRSADADDPVAEIAARRRTRPASPAPRPPVEGAAAAEIDRSTASVADGELRGLIRAAWKRLPPRGR